MLQFVPRVLQERCAQGCTCTPVFTVTLNFNAAAGFTPLDAALDAVMQTRAAGPMLATVSWTDCSGTHERMVIVSGNRARYLEADEPIPVQ